MEVYSDLIGDRNQGGGGCAPTQGFHPCTPADLKWDCYSDPKFPWTLDPWSKGVPFHHPPYPGKDVRMSQLYDRQSYPRELQLLEEIQRLHEENSALKMENQDLQLALLTTAEHGDIIEAELATTNHALKTEIAEHKRTELALKTLLELVTKQKEDLEIIIDTLTEHGDMLDAQWSTKVNQVKHLASLDGLTQIANRRGMDDYLQAQWQQLIHEQLPLSLILCDIDYFKQYNDAYGHLSGDHCLVQVAQVLTTVAEKHQGLAARYGGEEFAVILPRLGIQQARRTAKALQDRIRKLKIPHSSSESGGYVTLSLGIASAIATSESSYESLLDRADRLLYRAKAQGRDQIAY